MRTVLFCLIALSLFAAPAVLPGLEEIAPVGSADAKLPTRELPCRTNPDEFPEIECVL